MALEKTPICSFGEKIYDFNLKSVDEKNYTLKDIVGKKWNTRYVHLQSLSVC